jgi:NADPH-dependent 2,4-dienoyl-CoA reductase/sulfur reductase-like enzyme
VVWWAEHDVDLRTRTSVMKLDPAARAAVLSSKEEVSYDRALLATGANVRRLPVDGSELDGLHYLRALRNAEALRADAEHAERAVVVGGSFIAAEVAASLTTMGLRCALVMQEAVLLETTLGPRAGRWAQALLEEHGVEVHGGQDVVRFEGSDGRVERVVCASGLALAADIVVLGVGAAPDVMLARAAGLELGPTGGVACDAALRTTAPALWAAGDCCEYDSVLHGDRARIEHHDVAVAQGRHVARAMLGDEAPYAVVPSFWSDLADWATLTYVGLGGSWDREDVRGDLGAGAFSVVYRRAGEVVGCLGVGRMEDLAETRALIEGRTRLDSPG